MSTKTFQTDSGSEQLRALESIIKVNQPDFYAVGKALKEIRDSALYRARCNTFERYVQTQWDMSRSRAYRIIAALEVIEALSPFGDKVPKNEAQARPLTKLDASTLSSLWQAFLQSNQALTAENIRSFVSRHLTQQSKHSNNVMSEDYSRAVQNMLEQIQVCQNAEWQSTSRDTALYWNQVMKAKISGIA